MTSIQTKPGARGFAFQLTARSSAALDSISAMGSATRADPFQVVVVLQDTKKDACFPPPQCLTKTIPFKN
jgi:hypothetical protein